MDNILKLLIGVLAISGLIAFLVPSANPVAPPVISSPSPAAAPASLPDVNNGEEGNDASIDDEVEDEELDDAYSDDDDFKIGEPSIDGRPFDSEFNVPSDRPNAVVNSIDDTQQQPAIVQLPAAAPVPEPLPVTNSENTGY